MILSVVFEYNDYIMYGMSQEAMDRMERRIREKVYREMQEEQQKMRGSQDEQGGERRERRTRTESSRNQFLPDKYQRVQSRNEGQELQQQSFFLPILPSNRKTNEREDAYNRNDEYERYLSRRQPQPPKVSSSYQPPVSQTQDTVNMRAPQKEAPQEDEDKTLLYLQQCEQIISSLKELTTKQNRRSRRDSKFQTEASFRGYPTKSDRNEKETLKPSFNSSKNNSFRIGASTPVQRDDRQRSRVEGIPSETGISRSSTPLVSFWSSSKRKDEPKIQEYINEFDEFNEPENKEEQLSRIAVMDRKDKPSKMRENNIKISPPKEDNSSLEQSTGLKEGRSMDKANGVSISPRDEEEEKNQFEQSEQKPKNEKPKPQPKQASAKPKQSPTKTKQSPVKPKQSPSKIKQKEKKDAASKQTKEEEPASDKNKQQAIVTYLKKARMRGNLLSQKIEQRKKQQPDQEEAN